MPQSRRNQKPASSSHSKEAVESMSGGPTSSTRSDRWPDEHPLDPANSAAFNERKAAFDHFSPKAKRLKRGEEHHQQHQEQKEGQAKARKMSKPDGQVEGETLEGDANDGPDKGRPWTLAIAIPGSMLDNATSHEMKTYITGQVARAAAVFCVDEVVVYNDGREPRNKGEDPKRNVLLMAKILQYAECPQYLRSSFFPLHEDLKSVGLLHPLDAPHHLRSHEKSRYREGVVLEPETRKGDVPKSFVNVGLRKNAVIQAALEPHLRVTVQFRNLDAHEGDEELVGEPVPPDRPRTHSGLYWGYTVRVADSLSAILCQGPHEDGYDLTVGVSPKGQSVLDQKGGGGGPPLPSFRHAIIVLPGSTPESSLERLLEEDAKLEVKDPEDLFDLYMSPIPRRCSTSPGHIRTEESLLISLSFLRPKLASASSSSQDQ